MHIIRAYPIPILMGFIRPMFVVWKLPLSVYMTTYRDVSKPPLLITSNAGLAGCPLRMLIHSHWRFPIDGCTPKIIQVMDDHDLVLKQQWCLGI